MKLKRLSPLVLLTITLSITACAPKTSHYLIESEPIKPPPPTDTLFLSPPYDFEKLFTEHLFEAEKTVIVHSDSLLPPTIIHALKDIVVSKVQVGVILNQSSVDLDTTIVDLLTSAGIYTYIDTLDDLPSGDLAVIDGEIVLFGSFISIDSEVDTLKLLRNPYSATLYTRGWLEHSEHCILSLREEND